MFYHQKCNAIKPGDADHVSAPRDDISCRWTKSRAENGPTPKFAWRKAYATVRHLCLATKKRGQWKIASFKGKLDRYSKEIL